MMANLLHANVKGSSDVFVLISNTSPSFFLPEVYLKAPFFNGKTLPAVAGGSLAPA